MLGQLVMFGAAPATRSATRCAVCHRELRDPKSVREGVGPVCRAQGGDQGQSTSPAVRVGPPADLGLLDHAAWEATDSRRAASGEADYGCHWRMVGTLDWLSLWRISVVLVTGEVYAMRLQDRKMFVLGVLQPVDERDPQRSLGPATYETPGIYEAAEAWLKGWAGGYVGDRGEGDLPAFCAHLCARIPSEART